MSGHGREAEVGRAAQTWCSGQAGLGAWEAVSPAGSACLHGSAGQFVPLEAASPLGSGDTHFLWFFFQLF